MNIPPPSIPATGILRELNHEAWKNFMFFAISEKKIRDRFQAETGIDPLPSQDRLIDLVDDATGYSAYRLSEFVKWVTVNLWGLDCAPIKLREMIEAEQSNATAKAVTHV